MLETRRGETLIKRKEEKKKAEKKEAIFPILILFLIILVLIFVLDFFLLFFFYFLGSTSRLNKIRAYHVVNLRHRDCGKLQEKDFPPLPPSLRTALYHMKCASPNRKNRRKRKIFYASCRAPYVASSLYVSSLASQSLGAIPNGTNGT